MYVGYRLNASKSQSVLWWVSYGLVVAYLKHISYYESSPTKLSCKRLVTNKELYVLESALTGNLLRCIFVCEVVVVWRHGVLLPPLVVITSDTLVEKVGFWKCWHTHLCCRPYCLESTGSHPNSKVKQDKARLVLGWATAWETLGVLTTFSIHFQGLCTPSWRCRPVRAQCWSQAGRPPLKVAFWAIIFGGCVVARGRWHHGSGKW
jgi:hypothetical protein